MKKFMKKQDIARKNKLLAEICNRLAKQRNLLGVSQEELADKADLERTYISGIERGKRNISVFTLKKISDALGVEISTFFINEK